MPLSIRLFRHATLHIDYAGRRFLVDPMLSAKGMLDPAANSGNALRNPRVDLPVPVADVLAYDECLLTHAHRDHLDAAALEVLPKDRPILCQPEDAERLGAAGFRDVVSVADRVVCGRIEVFRTQGEHGRGPMLAKMGASSGFVLKHPDEPTLYVAGDTVFCPSVQAALCRHRPEVIVVNAGAAQFLEGGPITMDSSGVVALAREAPLAQIVVAHMEAWNHCLLSRSDLIRELQSLGLDNRVRVPSDGERVSVAA